MIVLGLPGENIDLVELKSGSAEKQYAKAIKGIQAVIFCDNFVPSGNSTQFYFRFKTV